VSESRFPFIVYKYKTLFLLLDVMTKKQQQSVVVNNKAARRSTRKPKEKNQSAK
jgi:hypothetical protein